MITAPTTTQPVPPDMEAAICRASRPLPRAEALHPESTFLGQNYDAQGRAYALFWCPHCDTTFTRDAAP